MASLSSAGAADGARADAGPVPPVILPLMAARLKRPFIGIPVLNRLDLLGRCIGAIDLPAEIVVVNNNALDASFKNALHSMAAEKGFTVLDQPRNLGVAASWNLILRIAFDNGHEHAFIGSNDTFLQPGSLLAALKAAEREPDVGLWRLHAFNFFLMHRRTIERVGWFDENFYPAYKEDQDYSYRCALAGIRCADVPGADAEHAGSATINSDPHYAARNEDTHFNWNQNHYLMKWGGDAGAERFTAPYGRTDVDWRWWPDPGSSIEARDWDRDRADVKR